LPDKAFSPAVSHPTTQTDATVPARTKLPEYALQVLVVEDNAELRHFIGQNLFGEYAVLEAENGLAGYEKAVQAIPDVIISDLMMPGLDGLNLCEKLKTDERTSHIPLILLTAKADIESRLQGLSTGADDYLTKPFHLEELQLRVRNLLESRKRMQERLGKQLHLNPQEIPVNSPDERFLNRVLSIMEAQLANADFDVEVFSREIGLSRTHLHRKLTALTGQAPNEFIRTFRLKRAARLLEQQHGNVSEIAYSVGFSTLNYFTKCFKDFYGVTPTEYSRKGAPSQVDNV
jgi:DNA-binding response OmpR family regulator